LLIIFDFVAIESSHSSCVMGVCLWALPGCRTVRDAESRLTKKLTIGNKSVYILTWIPDKCSSFSGMTLKRKGKCLLNTILPKISTDVIPGLIGNPVLNDLKIQKIFSTTKLDFFSEAGMTFSN
jgi:hypothetical protein